MLSTLLDAYPKSCAKQTLLAALPLPHPHLHPWVTRVPGLSSTVFSKKLVNLHRVVSALLPFVSQMSLPWKMDCTKYCGSIAKCKIESLSLEGLMISLERQEPYGKIWGNGKPFPLGNLCWFLHHWLGDPLVHFCGTSAEPAMVLSILFDCLRVFIAHMSFMQKKTIALTGEYLVLIPGQVFNKYFFNIYLKWVMQT